MARNHAGKIEAQQRLEAGSPLLHTAPGLQVDIGISLVEHQVAGVQNALIGKQHCQVAVRMACAGMNQLNGFPAYEQGHVIGKSLRRQQAGRIIRPELCVQRMEMGQCAFGSQYSGAGFEGRVAVSVVEMVVGIDQQHGFHTRQLPRLFADEFPLHRQSHGVHHYSTCVCPQHSGIATQAA